MSAPFAVRFAVRFRDVDLLRHVNNAVYFTYMETARTEYWISLFGTDAWKERSFILVRAECDYRKPATLGDEVEVIVRTSRIGDSSFDWDYEIRSAKSGELFASGKTVQVYYNYRSRASGRVPDDVRERLLHG
jgi:acyl-CoA thioester hydrolase